jgi:feruloyl esterase
MPTEWNHRFFYQGGGGTDGEPQRGKPQLQRYAVVSTDSGHDNSRNTSTVASSFEFGFDRRRAACGCNGPAEVTEKAKKASENSRRCAGYSFAGCSRADAGTHVLAALSGFFDGIVRDGMDLPKAAVAEAWDCRRSRARLDRRRRSIRTSCSFMTPSSLP